MVAERSGLEEEVMIGISSVEWLHALSIDPGCAGVMGLTRKEMVHHSRRHCDCAV